MKLVLINPSNNLFDTQDLAPPVGLLSIAAALEQEDIDIELIDFNLRGIAEPDFANQDFYAKAIDIIQSASPDIIGMTSMVINSHIVLELSKRLKAQNPDLKIVLGGTHFSSIAEEILSFYPWIDYVVKGEGEVPFRSLIRLVKSGIRLTAVNAPMNVAFREGEHVTSSHLMKPMESLDHLPFPSYHLVNVKDYFRLNRRKVLDFEPGRGCAFKCSFCYSPVHAQEGIAQESIAQE